MRIRTIKPEFFLHEGLFEAERAAKLPLRLAFAGLWCAADREGRFKWEPRRLGVQVLPYDNVDFSRVLDALATRGFIRKYASGTAEYGVIPSFTTHQVINNRERESELPEPPAMLQDQGLDACGTRDGRDEDGMLDLKSGREGNKEQGTRKGREGSKERDASFDEFWKLYPRREAKADAIKAWRKVKESEHADILAAVPIHTASTAWQKEDGRFIPLPASWLNARRWEDELKLAARSDVTNRQTGDLPSFLDDDDAIFHQTKP
jgi:hypothetical protein